MHNTNQSNPRTTPKPCEPKLRLASELTQKLNTGRAQNPLNFQERSNSAPSRQTTERKPYTEWTQDAKFFFNQPRNQKAIQRKRKPILKITMNNITLKCLVDTGSINVMKQNFFNFPIKPQSPHFK